MLALVLAFLSAPAPACVPGGFEPSGSEQLRPLAVLDCPYSGAVARRKVAGLLALHRRSASIEAIERLLSLPPLATMFDDPYDATYGAVLKGPGWSLRIDLAESFFPRAGPPRFRGSPRPRRVDPAAKGDISLKIMAMRPGLPGVSGACFSADDLARAAARLHWREQPPNPALDSGTITPTFARGDRERLMIYGVRSAGLGPSVEEMRSACDWDLDLGWDAR